MPHPFQPHLQALTPARTSRCGSIPVARTLFKQFLYLFPIHWNSSFQRFHPDRKISEIDQLVFYFAQKISLSQNRNLPVIKVKTNFKLIQELDSIQPYGSVFKISSKLLFQNYCASQWSSKCVHHHDQIDESKLKTHPSMQQYVNHW